MWNSNIIDLESLFVGCSGIYALIEYETQNCLAFPAEREFGH